MKDIFLLYRDRLTDLTRRNKSLCFMRVTNKNHFDIYSFNTSKNEAASEILRNVCSRKTVIPLLPETNFEEEEKILSHKLTVLRREIDLIEQETGVNTFFVGYDLLEGYLFDDFFIRSPIKKDIRIFRPIHTVSNHLS